MVNDQDGTLSVYSVDSARGKLRHRTYQSGLGNNPRSVALDLNGRFPFASIAGSPNGIKVFALHATSGEPGTPEHTNVAGGCVSFGFDPAGRYLYCANGAQAHAFAIGAAGALIALAGSPYVAGASPHARALDPRGRYLYVTDSNNDQVVAFAVNASGAPTRSAHLSARAAPLAIAFSVGTTPVTDTPRFAYTANIVVGNQGYVSQFRIDSDGALTATGTIGAGTHRSPSPPMPRAA